MAEARREGPKALLSARGLKAKRSFGQNFLADAGVARKIAALASEPGGGSVLEIGAGLGALTRPLLERAARVIAVERDRDLIPVLCDELAEHIQAGRLELVEADAKRIDPAALLASGPAPRVLAGNLPYQLTGPLLEQAVHAARAIDRAVFLVQLEVAARLADRPGGESWGALSVFVQAQFDVKRALVVKRGAFHPQPGVDSAVVVLTPLARPQATESDAFRALVHAAFEQRRKTLRNAWHGVLGRSEREIAEAAIAVGIDLGARGETLGVSDFARMAEALER